MDSPANILLASGELLDYLDNELVYQDQADVGAEMILEQVSNSVQKKYEMLESKDMERSS